MSAEELLTGDALFSDDEMTMEMDLDKAARFNKNSLKDVKEMKK